MSENRKYYNYVSFYRGIVVDWCYDNLNIDLMYY